MHHRRNWGGGRRSPAAAPPSPRDRSPPCCRWRRRNCGPWQWALKRLSQLKFGNSKPQPFRHGAHAMNATDVNLYLVGFMGTGKTTIGRAVAHKLGFNLLDSDHEIEKQQKKTIPDIFAQEGEPAFRVMERDFIDRGHPAERTVVACGGGLVVQPGMLALLRTKAVVACRLAWSEPTC